AGAGDGPPAHRIGSAQGSRKRHRDRRRSRRIRCFAHRAQPRRRTVRLHRRWPRDRADFSDGDRLAGKAQARRCPRDVVAVSGLDGRRSDHPGRNRRGDRALRNRLDSAGSGHDRSRMPGLVLAGAGSKYRGQRVKGPARWLGITAAVLLTIGCEQGSGESPSQSPPAPPSPSPSPSSVAALPCRMPVDLRTDQGGNREVLGYLSLPSGTTTDDPTDAIVKVADFPVSSNGTVPIWGTSTSPQLFGVGFGTRTSPAGRWLPAPPELVSPDGRHYAYRHANGTLRLAAVDGSELPVANPNDLAPLAYTISGVVLAQNGPAANGLWLLDPTTQAVTVITPPTGT